MLSHATESADGELVNTDLCIVGAWSRGHRHHHRQEFLNSDTRVCLLESGGRGAEISFR